MTSYPFIKDLFTNVLLKSKAIKGRFYICPRFGIELNSETLSQVLSEALVNAKPHNKYPLALMMPPRSRGEVKFNLDEFEAYHITMFFLKQTYYGEGAAINKNTQTSTHTVDEDWHDMKRCANGFVRVLDRMTRKTPGLVSKFRIHPDDKLFNPVSLIGTDRASGIQLDFNISLFTGCTLEDYTEADIETIEVPVSDSHPEHLL